MSYKIPALSIVTNQFPDFVKEDYPQFVNFVKLYYQFLNELDKEGVGENLESIRDLDITLDKFVDVLWKEVGLYIPRTTQANDRSFLKHIKEFYSTKGSEESFRILFRHLFDLEIDIVYPQERILKTSDGRWTQDFSIVVNVLSGNLDTLIGQFITISTGVQYVNVKVARIESIGSYYELFLEPFRYENILVGDKVTASGFDAVIVETISKVSIYKGGIGYSVGQVYNVPSEGLEAQIKITEVNSDGTITAVKLINFGSAYTKNFYIYLDHELNSYEFAENSFESVATPYDSVTIFKELYASIDYVDPMYWSELLLNVSSSVPSRIIRAYDDDLAILTMTIGSVRRYPGYYYSDNGFLSNAYFLQDKYYQLYTYVIKCSESILMYKEVIKKVIHPSGMKLFGEQIFDTEQSIPPVLVINDLLFIKSLADYFSFNESHLFNITKKLTDVGVVTERRYSLFTKAPIVEAAFNVTDTYRKLTTKNKTESVAFTDSCVRTNTKNVTDTFTFSTPANSINSDIVGSDIYNTTITGMDLFSNAPINSFGYDSTYSLTYYINQTN